MSRDLKPGRCRNLAAPPGLCGLRPRLGTPNLGGSLRAGLAAHGALPQGFHECPSARWHGYNPPSGRCVMKLLTRKDGGSAEESAAGASKPLLAVSSVRDTAGNTEREHRHRRCGGQPAGLPLLDVQDGCCVVHQAGWRLSQRAAGCSSQDTTPGPPPHRAAAARGGPGVVLRAPRLTMRDKCGRPLAGH